MGAIRERDTTDFASSLYRNISDMVCPSSTYMLRDHGVASFRPSPPSVRAHAAHSGCSRAGYQDRAHRQAPLWLHNTYIHQEDDHANEIQRQHSPLTLSSNYMKWYWGIPRRWIFKRVAVSNGYHPGSVHERHLVISQYSPNTIFIFEIYGFYNVRIYNTDWWTWAGQGDDGGGFAEGASEGLDTPKDPHFHEGGANMEPICTPIQFADSAPIYLTPMTFSALWDTGRVGAFSSVSRSRGGGWGRTIQLAPECGRGRGRVPHALSC